MNILVLGPQPSKIAKFLIQRGYSVFECDYPIDEFLLKREKIEFAISYGYRHIIKPEIIKYLEGKIINLHISYLPWNRGSDPNFWSFLENTLKGVTIHYVDSGLDTGDIVFQKQIMFEESKMTLSTTYEILSNEIFRLFKDGWEQIIHGKAPRFRQKGKGSYHNSKDKEPYQYLIEKHGWDTPVEYIKGKALPQ